jgi:hypothetical protein
MSGENIHIIGATFRVSGPVRIGGGWPDITDWTVSAVLRGPGFLCPFECSLAWDAAKGCTMITLGIDAAEQSGWREGHAELDVRLTAPDGFVLITSKAFITLRNPVTK